MKLQKLGGLAIALVALVNTSASAGERPSQATLDAMGLGGITVMDDADALAVRGHGFKGHSKRKSSARAWGSSYASVAGHGAQASSENGYDAQGEHVALGANVSVAGIIVTQSGGGHGGGGGPALKSGKGKSKGGGGYGGGGHGGGKPRVKSVTVFAGGGSFAYAD